MRRGPERIEVEEHVARPVRRPVRVIFRPVGRIGDQRAGQDAGHVRREIDKPAGAGHERIVEWVQDRHGYFWTEKEVNDRLEAKMSEAYDAVLQTALRYKVDMRTAAYIVAINRVATVTRLRGMYA